MNEQEVIKILSIASAAYPSWEVPKETIKIWQLTLSGVEPNKAFNNLTHHIKTSRFAPTVADIINEKEKPTYPLHKQLAKEKLIEIENVKSKAVKIPNSIREMIESESITTRE